MKNNFVFSLFTLIFVAQFGLFQKVNGDDISGVSSVDTDFQEENIEVFGLDNTKIIALTFDDGPGKGTAQILDALKRYNIKATFFALGQQMKANPELTRRIVREGHVLGNHSYTHPDLRQGKYELQPELLMQELLGTHEVLKQFIRPNAKLFFRAPYAAWVPSRAEVLNLDPELRRYIGPICWDVGRNIEWDNKEFTNAADWECWSKKNTLSVKTCSDGYLHKIREIGGGVVLMHDIHQKTADMVDILIPELIAEGYKFKTLEELPEFEKYPIGSGPRVEHLEPPDSESSAYKGRCLPTRRPNAKKFAKPEVST